MEDQFGGRTDDDLFYDDFEPVESEAVVIKEPAQPAPEPLLAATPVGDVSSASASVSDQKTAPTATKIPASDPVANAPAPAPQGLATSRYADKPVPPPETKSTSPQPAADSSNKPPPNAPTAPKEKYTQRQGGPNAKGAIESRLKSGANPRQKLTEDELSAKMQQMKVIAAEKTRKFEKAEQDEKQHAEAYARGMEEARKRRIEAEERRKRGEENQRQLNNERERNRERKLKAMGMKEGGWDEGKEAISEEESRRGFKGANGGIRGSRRGGGLGGSRYAQKDEEVPDVDRFLDDRHRGRGRGRGRGQGGRGRGGATENASTQPAPPKQSVPTAEEFPALPSDSKRPVTPPSQKPITTPLKPLEPMLPPSPAKWDDEMNELDETKQGK